MKALGDYQDISQIDALLVKYLQQKDLSHAYFYLDRFSQFTARELQLVQALIKNAQATTIALVWIAHTKISCQMSIICFMNQGVSTIAWQNSPSKRRASSSWQT